jgi:hypothetical protein
VLSNDFFFISIVFFCLKISLTTPQLSIIFLLGKLFLKRNDNHGENFSYSHIIMFLYSHILIFSYSHILIFSYSHILIFSYSHILIFSYSHILNRKIPIEPYVYLKYIESICEFFTVNTNFNNLKKFTVRVVLEILLIIYKKISLLVLVKPCHHYLALMKCINVIVFTNLLINVAKNIKTSY